MGKAAKKLCKCLPKVGRAGIVNKLNALKVEKLTKPGRHADGNGLYLNVSPTGAKSWVFLFQFGGRRREMGLGPLSLIPLKRARDLAIDCRRRVAEGVDPLEERKPARGQKVRGRQAQSPSTVPATRTSETSTVISSTGLTFKDFAEEYVGRLEAGWRNPKHRQQWRNTLSTYAYPHIGDRLCGEVSTDDMLAVLTPIWSAKPETANRVRGRIEAILDAARVQGHRTGENPAQWKGHLSHLLTPRAKLARVKHHGAMPYKDVPAFYAKLRERTGSGAMALRFAILTAARSSEVRLATWSEIDLKDAVWTVPPSRMKADREHVVPLSAEALAILQESRKSFDDAPPDDSYVFPGLRNGRLSENTLNDMVGRMGLDQFTAHGFRSSFRDWAGDETDFQREVAEAALAHVVGDRTEAAYRRGTALEKRRALMNAWSSYVAGTGAGARPVEKATAASGS